MSVEIPKPREIIFINIGKTGCEVGDSFWELFNAEHKINDAGFSFDDSRDSISLRAVYDEVGRNKYVPRNIFIDLEPDIIDTIRQSRHRSLYHPDQYIHGMQDSSNNYGRSHNNLGKKIIEKIMEQVRKQVENISGLQGIFISHSIGGGTGSGLYSLVAEQLSHHFSKTLKFDICVFPAPTLSELIVEPYNACLSTALAMYHMDLGYIMDNEAIWDICTKKLHHHRPTFANIDRLISQVISSVTAPMRFKGQLQGDLSEFMTNLIAFPRLHFPLVTMSPIMPDEVISHETLDTMQLTKDLFRPDHSFVKCKNLSTGRFLSAVIMFRGDVNMIEAKESISMVRNHVKFASWCPAGVKMDINDSPPHRGSRIDTDIGKLPRSVCMVANHTAVGDAWTRIISKFKMLYAKRSFFHWFAAEGVEETEFQLSIEDMDHMIRDYEQAAID